MKRLGVDVGGTFTDLIYVDDEAGTIVVHKLPSTPDDPSRATVEGIRQLTARVGTEPRELDQVVHGTTVATNIVIEHDGAKVGMITSEGYRDILHIARHKKPMNFSIHQELPWQAFPLVRRRYRKTVPERIGGDGEVIVELDEDKAREQVRELKRAGVESIAICFLFSFLRPEHEQRVKEIVQEEYPEAFLSVSSEVLPQYREYERFSTVALNAFVGPRVAHYIDRLQTSLKDMGVASGVQLMTSGSGISTAQGAIERPVNLLMSGPVAGVVGGIWFGQQSGFDSVITLDVGGTSADIGLSQGGRLQMKHLLDTRVGPYQAMIPMVDVDTIGAGGGSIAYLDDGGIFRSGPRSAGAQPGPATYDRGGTQPTSTDAMANLGWLLPEDFLGGEMTLRLDLARKAYEPLAEKLGASVEEASHGAIQIAIHLMVQAIEENSVRKGFDPRDFALVAQGGAGPAFAAAIGREVNTPAVVVPQYPGVTAALGLLVTDETYEYAATAYQKISELRPEELEASFEKLESEARAQLEADGIPPERQVIQRIADCRYIGQGYELRVDVPGGPIDQNWTAELTERFHVEHEREYSRRFEGSDIELPNIRVRGIGLMPRFDMPEIESGGSDGSQALRHTGKAWFAVDGELREFDTNFYAREALLAGDRIEGPAVINQYDTTTVVPPELAAEVDKVGNIVIWIDESARERFKDEMPLAGAVNEKEA